MDHEGRTIGVEQVRQRGGRVQHRVGDGPLDDIPQGQEVQVDVALASMVVSWTSEGQPVTVTLAREEFMYYVDEGSIAILR